MLHGLGGSDEGRIQYLLVVNVARDVAGFLEDAVNGRAIHALGFDAVHFEDFFETDDLVLGLCQMCFKTVFNDGSVAFSIMSGRLFAICCSA